MNGMPTFRHRHTISPAACCPGVRATHRFQPADRLLDIDPNVTAAGLASALLGFTSSAASKRIANSPVPWVPSWRWVTSSSPASSSPRNIGQLPGDPAHRRVPSGWSRLRRHSGSGHHVGLSSAFTPTKPPRGQASPHASAAAEATRCQAGPGAGVLRLHRHPVRLLRHRLPCCHHRPVQRRGRTVPPLTGIAGIAAGPAYVQTAMESMMPGFATTSSPSPCSSSPSPPSWPTTTSPEPTSLLSWP